MEVEIWPPESGAQAWSALLSQRANGCEEPEMMSQDIATCINFGWHGYTRYTHLARCMLRIKGVADACPTSVRSVRGGDGSRWAKMGNCRGIPMSILRWSQKMPCSRLGELQGFLRRVTCKGSTRVWRTIWYLWVSTGFATHNHSYILFESVYILGSLWYFKCGRKFVNYLGEPSTIYKICKHTYRHCVVYRWIDG